MCARETDIRTGQDFAVEGTNYRISVLTDRLIRFEYSPQGVFVDAATQVVVNRKFPSANYEIRRNGDEIEILTEYLVVKYNQKKFSQESLRVRLRKGAFSWNATWRYGDACENNLGGTVRTLDNVDGAIPLENGLLSRNGFTVMDDSKSMIMTEDGWIKPAPEEHTDIYFWGYGYAYKECLKAFYHLCGQTPMLPRFALGNWWSRFYAYTQEEYLGLMERFRREQIPFAVAVIDMDWHYVQLDEKYGSGWTGYTWNEKLFPDHQEMLKKLHQDGMHVTLNVHPADGVRGHEKAYLPMAAALGLDAESGEAIPFDAADRRFMAAYFEYLHHPLEREGVDFWWIDWQQGKISGLKGLDPLWVLNHFHFEDQKREGKRPMIFSRYAGLGSHRYPIGFSGDSIITWKSLDFQPYFTATASNAGYGWWSHDIGGHMNGYRDDELMVRWVQFGTFSPIMRLHSSCSRFTGKEPWNYPERECGIITRYLRLRHAMIPYLYTMNERNHSQGESLIQPMYYEYPEENNAYEVPGQYFFGNSLLIHPITARTDEISKMSAVTSWLPQGEWIDVFSGLRYHGGRMIKMYRPLEEIPVLMPQGGIIPLQQTEHVSSFTANPEDMEMLIAAGDDGQFVLYEDDGETMRFEEGHVARTEYRLEWKEKKVFMICPVEGETQLLPEKRNYRIKVYCVRNNCVGHITVNGQEQPFEQSYDKKKNILTIVIDGVPVAEELAMWFEDDSDLEKNEYSDRIFELLNRCQIEYCVKDRVFDCVSRARNMDEAILQLNAMELPRTVYEAIAEILLA